MLLYIHIPFCDSKCGYCAFASFVAPKSLHAPYFAALHRELDHRLLPHMRFSSLFVGGGTPNVVSERFYAPLLERLAPYLRDDCELSIELNPNHLAKGFVATMRALGFNRISLGAQSFNAQKLQWLMRRHDPRSIFKACDMLYRAGFTNLNVDVIYNTPFDSPQNLAFEASNIAKLPLSHVSAYALSIDEGSAFFASGREAANDGEELCALLSDLGFVQYEVSNYAKNDKVCRHNLGYWQHKDYLGIGASAVSFCAQQTSGTRSTNAKTLQAYLANPLWQDVEILSAHDLRFEQLFLGLRCCYGAPKAQCNAQKLRIALRENLVRCENERVVANNLFLADSLALFLES